LAIAKKPAVNKINLSLTDISPNAEVFAAELKTLKIPIYEIKPDETIFYRGKQMVKK
jgi:hypothetical protein